MKHTRQKGSLKWIILIVIGIVLASYFFDFSVKDAVEDEQTQENFGYISENAKNLYNNHLKNATEYLWNDVFKDLLWSSFVDNLERIKAGEPSDFELAAPTVNINTTADITNPPIQTNSPEEENTE